MRTAPRKVWQAGSARMWSVNEESLRRVQNVQGHLYRKKWQASGLLPSQDREIRRSPGRSPRSEQTALPKFVGPTDTLNYQLRMT